MPWEGWWTVTLELKGKNVGARVVLGRVGAFMAARVALVP